MGRKQTAINGSALPLSSAVIQGQACYLHFIPVIQNDLKIYIFYLKHTHIQTIDFFVQTAFYTLTMFYKEFLNLHM